MSLFLLLETSGKNCSVALANDKVIIASRSSVADHFIHAEELHGLIHNLSQENHIALQSLSAIAVSKGPGSYTGLRIGVSAAKGLCYALKLPLIAIDTTEILAHYASAAHPDATCLFPAIDARRLELYGALFDEKLNRMKEDEPIIIDEHTFQSYPPEKLIIVGDGAEKCRPYVDPRVRIMHVLPEARMMHQAVLHAWMIKQFEDVAYFEPFYLKEYTPGTSKKNTL